MAHYEASAVIKHLLNMDEKTSITMLTNLKTGESEDDNIDYKNCSNRNDEIHIPQVFLQSIWDERNNEDRSHSMSLSEADTSSLDGNCYCTILSPEDIPHVPYEELQTSTNNWDRSTTLGEGAFGVVYAGSLEGGLPVAIKRLEVLPDSPEGSSQMVAEINYLAMYRHQNILPIYGHSIDGQYPCIIYHYMAGGSLYQRMKTYEAPRMLTWPMRLDIAIGMARGLEYLHTSLVNRNPVIHGDIKPANILLDHKDQARIGDFGLAKDGPLGEGGYIKVSQPRGTWTYLPGDFLQSRRLSTRVDVYSFGVVILELATGLSAWSMDRRRVLLTDHVGSWKGNYLDLKNKRVVPGFDEYFEVLIEVGLICSNKNGELRPSMSSALSLLESRLDNLKDKFVIVNSS